MTKNNAIVYPDFMRLVMLYVQHVNFLVYFVVLLQVVFNVLAIDYLIKAAHAKMVHLKMAQAKFVLVKNFLMNFFFPFIKTQK